MSATAITVTLDKAVTLTNVGFTLNVVSGDPVSISSVSGSGTTVISLNLSRAIIEDDVLTLDYDSSVGDAVTNVGVRLQSFTGMLVVNNIGFSPSAEYQAILDRATFLGYTEPSIPQQELDDAMITSLKSSGIWDELDVFYWHGTDGDRDFAKLNWKNPSLYEQDEISTVTFTSSFGFQGNGSTGVLDWTWAATNGSKYLRNDSSFGVYLNIGSAGTGGINCLIGAFGQVYLGEIIGELFGRIQNGTGNSFGASSAFFAGHTYSVRRIGASATDNLVDGVVVASGSDASIANDSHTFYTFGNNVGAVQFPETSDIQVAGQYAGSSSLNQVALHSAMRTRMLGNIVLGAYFSSVTQTKVSISGKNSLSAFGDSITSGSNASDAAHRYINIVATSKGLALTNYGLGGSGVWYMASASQATAFDNTDLLTAMAGYNDIRRNGAAAKTLKKIEACFRTLFVRALRNNLQDASGSGAVTRSGTFSGFAASSYGGLYGSGSIPGSVASYSQTSGDYWEWAFTGTAFSVQFIASDGAVATYGTCNVIVDGNTVASIDLNNWYDGVSDGVYDNARGPLAYSYHGFTNTSHTVRIQVTSNNIVAVDLFEKVNAPASSPAILFAEIPYTNSVGYASSPSSGSIAASDSASNVIKLLVDEYLALGYNIAFVKTNTYYNVYTGISSDNIHPADSGMADIATAFTTAII